MNIVATTYALTNAWYLGLVKLAKILVHFFPVALQLNIVQPFHDLNTSRPAISLPRHQLSCKQERRSVLRCSKGEPAVMQHFSAILFACRF